MSEWQRKKLSDIALVIMGQSPPGETYNTTGEGLPFFQGKAEFGDVSPSPVKWCSAPLKIAEPGDILISVRAPVGPTNIADVKSCIGRGLAAIRVRESKMIPAFLGHFLKAHEQSIAKKGVGSTFNAISKDDIENLEVPAPPLSEQLTVVRLLDDAGQLRQLRAEADRRTNDLIPALFHEMFNSNREYSRKRLEDICSSPAGIKAGPFGSSLKKECYTTEGPRVYGQEQTIANDFSVGDYHINQEKYAEMRAYAVAPGDILISLVGTYGKVALVPEDAEPGIINPRLIRVRVDRQIMLPVFLKHYLQLNETQAHLQALARGQTMGVLNATLLKELSVIVPPLENQKTFAARVSKVQEFEAVQAIGKQRLNDLFQCLLHRAFQGEL